MSCDKSKVYINLISQENSFFQVCQYLEGEAQITNNAQIKLIIYIKLKIIQKLITLSNTSLH